MARRSRPDLLPATEAAANPDFLDVFAQAMQPLDQCLLALATDRKGLTEDEAAKRLQRDGPNEITPHRSFAIPTGLIAAGFWLPLIVVAVLLLFWSGRSMLAFLLISAVVLGFGSALVLGNRSLKPGTFEACASETRVRVKRQRSSSPRLKPGTAQAATISTVFEIPCRELVAGDIIELSAPAMTGYSITGAAIPAAIIPADIRILSANNLIVDQSALIAGSPSRVLKHAETPGEAVSSLQNLSNIGFMGSRICSGSATAVVIATGSRSCCARSRV